MKKVNNSNLPAIIKNDNTIFEKLEKIEKFIVGPTKLKPGPILPTQVKTEDIVVIRSNPFKEIITDPEKITKIYKNIKFEIFVATSGASVRFPMVIGIKRLG